MSSKLVPNKKGRKVIHSTPGAACCYAGCILTSVLKVIQSLMKILCGNILARLILPVAENKTKNSTHCDLGLKRDEVKEAAKTKECYEVIISFGVPFWYTWIFKSM